MAANLSNAEAEHIDVTVVLPVYNEVGHLEAEIDRITASLDASEYTYEILGIDDGSTDGSTELLRSRTDVRPMIFQHNRGSGSARRAGTEAARGDVVVWTDADMTYPNDQIPDLVRDMEGWDQIVGARTTEQGTVKLLRVPAKWIIRQLAQFLSQTSIPDLNSGLRAFRRNVAVQYTHMLPKGFSCVTTLTMAFLTNGYSVKYVDIPYEKRAGESKFHWRKDTRRYLTQVVRMALSWEPLRIFMPVGLLLFFVAVGKLIFDWTTRDFSLAANTLLLFFGAMQIIVVGLLADLVVRANKPQQLVTPAAIEL